MSNGSELCRRRERLLVFHIPIDRFTGQVTDKQIEAVNE
jgi:hypothetical protein